MKITRNNIEYELTPEELRLAREEYEFELQKLDVLERLEEREITFATDPEINAIIQRFNRALCRHDLYWDIYWEVMDSVIEEVMKEYGHHVY
jgi:hypothetical protein